ncbi:Signal transduction histidine kinase [Lentzea fradiae]|uniref:histidine kinase n=1 Tax=Lentzea fradiae TaxID=200378 RepID=A0A1G7NPU1_9PSEU|nr:histidine kinase [Lentzea fradiae]SDF75937.1 Signal transduction histidine kinase [Lentzea fradiae]
MDSVKMPLKHQSWLVAAVCMAADGGFVLFENDFPWPGALVLVLTLAVDAMLAGPARLSGWVALAQAVLPLVVLVAIGPGVESNDAGQLIAAYRAGAWLRGAPAFLSLGALFASLVVWSVGIGVSPAEGLLVATKAALLPWLVGRYTTARRAYLAELEKRSEMEKRDAKAAVAKAIADERSAIARDLHDVIVHHVSAIGLHAGAARLRLPDEDSKIAVSLRSVETSSRAAMVDLRHLLDLLHGDKSEGARQPGLDNVDELLEGVRSAGIPARLEVRGKKRDVPESLDITVYRIIQEMLTNALRHGDSSGVRVTLDYAAAALVVAAENVAGARGGSGAVRRGLVGIRNRASMFGGTTECGLEPDGRTWRTVVTFPLEES